MSGVVFSSVSFPETVSSNESISPKKMAQFIRGWTENLQNRNAVFLTETLQHFQDRETGVHVFGIHKNQQMAKDWRATLHRYEVIRSYLLALMGLDPNTSFVEIVGDSIAYSFEGTQAAKRFLKDRLSPDAVWVYGYTGHDESDGTQCVNAIVSSLVEEENHLDKTIGNLVGFHTPVALENWKCSAPLLEYNLLVYGNDESNRQTGTVFGDDIITSDFLCNTLYVIEGGVQSFCQACNFLRLEYPVIAIAGLRSERTRYGTLPDGSKMEYFSAVSFLQFLKDKKDQIAGEVSDDLLDSWYREYFDTHLLADPKRQDYDTKQNLFNEAWELFKIDGLVHHLEWFWPQENLECFEN